MNKYPYKYIHHDEVSLTSAMHWIAGTEICASKQVIFAMLRYYRQAHKISPLASLAEKGIFVDNHYGSWRILVCHPEPTASKEDIESFPHRKIAEEITRLWRQRHDQC